MNETALKVLKKINSNGYQAYLVGGYPRDIYIGRDSMDFDICTSATPKELKEIFNDEEFVRKMYNLFLNKEKEMLKQKSRQHRKLMLSAEIYLISDNGV